MTKIGLAIHTNFMDKDKSRGVLKDKWENVWLDQQEIADVLQKGHPICVAQLEEGILDEASFKSAQLIGLDFDKGPDVSYFNLVDSLSSQYSAIVYETFNSTLEAPRTRVLFVLEKPLTDKREYKAQVEALLSRYQHFGLDTVCKSAAQVFFGNHTGTYVVKNNAIPENMLKNMAIVAKTTGPDPEKKKSSELLLSGGESGSRNNDAVALVSKYANLLKKDDIEAIMKLWYEKISDKSDFPFSAVQTIINHYTEKSLSVQQAVERTVSSVIAPAEEKPLSEIRKMITPFYAFSGTTKVEWMIQDWLPVATTAMMVAPPQHFKTWISLAIAMSLGMNKPLFGEFPVLKPCNVLVMQQEDAKGITSSRSNLIYEQLMRGAPGLRMVNGDFYTGIINPAVSFYTADTTFQFSNPDAMRNLRSLIAEHKFGLVIIDPLYAATDSTDYMAKDASRMVELKRIRDSLGTSFMILHHTRKTVTPPVAGQPAKANRLDAWGSQFLNAWQETGIQIRGTDDPKSIAVTRYFKSSGENLTGVFNFDISTEENPRFMVTNTQTNVKGKIDVLKLLQEQGPISVSKFAKLIGVDPSTASRQLAKMAQKGTIVKLPNQLYASNIGDLEM